MKKLNIVPTCEHMNNRKETKNSINKLHTEAVWANYISIGQYEMAVALGPIKKCFNLLFL